MLSFIKEFINNKNVLILGLGREGASSLKMCKRAGSAKSISVADKNCIENTNGILDGVKDTIFGDEYQKCINDYDVVFKSPGIVFEDPEKVDFRKITSQCGLFLKRFSKQVVGITGTKGKSTVSSLTYHILKNAGRNCVFAGNIGIPFFDVADDIDSDTTIVCELSCHQLEYVDCSPHIAVLLNVFEEHLDHYGSFEKYRRAKQNIFNFQTKKDYLICPKSELTSDMDSDIIIADDIISNGKICFANKILDIPKSNLLGVHNEYNIGIAYAVCNLIGITDKEFISGVSSFNPLPHRLEFVATVDGVSFYDDSISTATETAIQALESVPNVQTIILGGMDRGIDYIPLIEFMSAHSVKNILLMPDTGYKIYDIIKNNYSEKFMDKNILKVENLFDAVCKAKEITNQGMSCVLSPAAASYGFFKNFEERGDKFKEYVLTQSSLSK